MKATTVIKNADWIVAYDEQRPGHKYIRNGDVAFADDRLTYVGKNYEGQADEIINGSDLLVMPGLLDLHLHAYQEIHGKGFFEDLASKHMWMTQLFEYTWLLQEDDESAIAAMQASACELLKSGCTTMAELYCSQRLPFEGWLDALAGTGIRAYACPMVNSGHWYTPNGRDHLYKWYEEEGLKNFAGALELIDAAESHS